MESEILTSGGVQLKEKKFDGRKLNSKFKTNY
jgi:hypothetical protein